MVISEVDPGTLLRLNIAIDDSRRPDASDCHNRENCENFKNSLLTEHLRVTVSGDGGSLETNIILKCNNSTANNSQSTVNDCQ